MPIASSAICSNCFSTLFVTNNQNYNYNRTYRFKTLSAADYSVQSNVTEYYDDGVYQVYSASPGPQILKGVFLKIQIDCQTFT